MLAMKFVSILICCVLLSNVQDVETQFDTSMVLSIVNNMKTRDKLLMVAQFLMDNANYYQDLEDTLLSAWPLLTYDQPHGYFTNVILPWSLHHLPGLLQSGTFKDVMRIFIEERNR